MSRSPDSKYKGLGTYSFVLIKSNTKPCNKPKSYQCLFETQAVNMFTGQGLISPNYYTIQGTKSKGRLEV